MNRSNASRSLHTRLWIVRALETRTSFSSGNYLRLNSKQDSIKSMAKRNQEREPGITRREMLRSLIGSIGFAALPRAYGEETASEVEDSSMRPRNRNPRWYGFNLLEYFSTDPDWMKYFPYRNDGAFREDDFRWMRDWGFNFARLPMDYRFWTDTNNPLKVDERKLEPIDRAIRLGELYGIHIDICLHRAPGFCILDSLDPLVTGIQVTPERTDLFTDPYTLDAFVFQWTVFAKRYKGISSNHLSFNLLNEPKTFTTPSKQVHGTQKADDSRGSVGQKSPEDGARNYVRIAHAAIDSIRTVDPDRLIVLDGINVATEPLLDLASTNNTVQSAHHYYPQTLTFYQAEWARGEKQLDAVPSWPLEDSRHGIVANRETMETFFHAWRKAARRGISLHCGEMGCYKHVPSRVALAWFGDALDVLGELEAGWALWNFRGPFGVLDTKRPETKYEDWYGHQLDRTLLNLLQKKKKE
ncbi:MAG TPA: cellulase family glycosylhydrolase [Alloacidobacterium sp.]|nr:cellulase family glycosylhydrolase [Alloacidobacterium sp.]